MKRTGFTLVEVLTVIGIIAVLAALLFPVYSRAKAEANRTTCVSNLRQWHLAVSLYRDAVDGIDQPARTSIMGFPPLAGDQYPVPVVGAAGKVQQLKCRGYSERPGTFGIGQLFPVPMPVPGLTQADVDREQEQWIKDVEAAQGNPIILFDQYHQLSYPTTRLSLQRCLGVALDGTLTTRIQRGDCIIQSWWRSPTR